MIPPHTGARHRDSRSAHGCSKWVCRRTGCEEAIGLPSRERKCAGSVVRPVVDPAEGGPLPTPPSLTQFAGVNASRALTAARRPRRHPPSTSGTRQRECRLARVAHLDAY
ncbi:hypothetical protein MRX96_005350 [Rhipicephalus microplus]